MNGSSVTDSFDSGEISKIAENQILVGRYQVMNRLGSGGTSTVYKARDLVLKRFVAVKLLRADTRSHDQLIRLQREARAICLLKHPNIIDAFDFIVDENNIPVLAMEYVEGISLDDFVKKNGPLEVDDAISVCEQICSALHYAHQHNVMHRDLKPANVIVQNTVPMAIKIIDFGIAKLSDEDGSLTTAGVIVGTPSFISPEQAQGDKVDFRSDIYSLGCLMYKILTGKNPFRGATIMDTLQAQIHEKAPSLSEANPTRVYPEELEEIISKALRKDPEDRFQSMSEFSAALAALNHTEQPAVQTSEADQSLPIEPSQTKRSKLLISVILLTVLASIGAIAVQISKTLFSESEEVKIDTSPDAILKSNQLGKKPVGNWSWYFSRSINVSDEQIEALRRLKADKLTLAKTNVTDEQLKLVAKLPLVLLDLRETNVSNEGIRTICDTMPNLRSIIIEHCPKIDSKGYRELKKLKELRILSLRDTTVSDEDLKELCPALPKLNLLYVSNSPNITDESIEPLLELKSLYSVRIDGTKVSPAAVNRLSVLPKAIFLGIGNLGINDYNMPTFSKNISMLDLSTNLFSIRGLREKVLTLPELWYLDLRSCPRIEDDHEVKSMLRDRFDYHKGFAVMLDDHAGMTSGEGYLDPELYRDNKLKQFSLEQRKAAISEAMRLFPDLEKGF